jgi:hypothetical protein
MAAQHNHINQRLRALSCRSPFDDPHQKQEALSIKALRNAGVLKSPHPERTPTSAQPCQPDNQANQGKCCRMLQRVRVSYYPLDIA